MGIVTEFIFIIIPPKTDVSRVTSLQGPANYLLYQKLSLLAYLAS